MLLLLLSLSFARSNKTERENKPISNHIKRQVHRSEGKTQNGQLFSGVKRKMNTHTDTLIHSLIEREDSIIDSG